MIRSRRLLIFAGGGAPDPVVRFDDFSGEFQPCQKNGRDDIQKGRAAMLRFSGTRKGVGASLRSKGLPSSGNVRGAGDYSALRGIASYASVFPVAGKGMAYSPDF